VIVTHLFGRVCDMDAVLKLTTARNVFLIEDCAQALGATYKGKKAGSFGDAALFSFGLGKDVMCFGGGMVAVTGPSVAKAIEKKIACGCSLSRTAIIKEIFKYSTAVIFSKRIVFHFFVFPFLKFFYVCKNLNLLDALFEEAPGSVSQKFLKAPDNRLSDFQAAVGLEQIPFIDTENQKRIANAKILNEELKGLSIAFDLAGENTIYSAYKILIADRKVFRKKLFLRGIDTQREDIHACSTFTFMDNDNHCPVSEALSRRLVGLPNYASLTRSDLRKIAQVIKGVFNEM